MSWTTEVSSWKSIMFRYDGSRVNHVVLKKCYTLVALISQLEWANPEGVQFHRSGVIFLSEDSYLGEEQYTYFLDAPDGTTVTATVTDDNTRKLGLLTAVKLEDGWILTFTIHPEHQFAGDQIFPKQKRRAHCLSFDLDSVRVEGQFWYGKVGRTLHCAIVKLEQLDSSFLRRKHVKSEPRGTLFSTVYGFDYNAAYVGGDCGKISQDCLDHEKDRDGHSSCLKGHISGRETRD